MPAISIIKLWLVWRQKKKSLVTQHWRKWRCTQLLHMYKNCNKLYANILLKFVELSAMADMYAHLSHISATLKQWYVLTPSSNAHDDDYFSQFLRQFIQIVNAVLSRVCDTKVLTKFPLESPRCAKCNWHFLGIICVTKTEYLFVCVCVWKFAHMLTCWMDVCHNFLRAEGAYMGWACAT